MPRFKDMDSDLRRAIRVNNKNADSATEKATAINHHHHRQQQQQQQQTTTCRDSRILGNQGREGIRQR